MRKGIFVLTIIMFFLSWIPGYASRQLFDSLIGKTVVVESKGRWRSTIGVFTGYDAEKIYLSRATDKWTKKIYSKYKNQEDNPYKLPLKKGSYLLLNSEVEDILLVKDGLEPELYLELEDIDPIDLPAGKEDPNADLRPVNPNRDAVYMRTIWKLTSMTGWNNFKGKWISEQNYIPLKPRDVIGEISSSLEGLFQAKEAFDEWKIKIITHQGKSWLALFKKKTRLSGKHSYIRELDTSRSATWYTYWIFSRDEFLEQLRRIKDGQPNLMNIQVLARGEWSLKDLMEKWETLSSEFPANAEKNHHFYINIRPFKERNIFQVLLFEWPEPGFSEKKYVPSEKESRVMNEGELNNLFERATTEKLYNECYFEGKYTDFENFIKIIEIEK